MNRSRKTIGSSTNHQKNSNQQPYSAYTNDQQHPQNILTTASNLFSGNSNTAPGSFFGSRSNFPKGPQVVPHTGSNNQQQHTQPYASKNELININFE